MPGELHVGNTTCCDLCGGDPPAWQDKGQKACFASMKNRTQQLLMEEKPRAAIARWEPGPFIELPCPLDKAWPGRINAAFRCSAVSK
ncbi:unnamed protein product [Caretta caretta]